MDFLVKGSGGSFSLVIYVRTYRGTETSSSTGSCVVGRTRQDSAGVLGSALKCLSLHRNTEWRKRICSLWNTCVLYLIEFNSRYRVENVAICFLQLKCNKFHCFNLNKSLYFINWKTCNVISNSLLIHTIEKTSVKVVCTVYYVSFSRSYSNRYIYIHSNN